MLREAIELTGRMDSNAPLDAMDSILMLEVKEDASSPGISFLISFIAMTAEPCKYALMMLVANSCKDDER